MTHILLVEPNYYTRYPPIGLLKLSAYHKIVGDTTELIRGLQRPAKKPDVIYVTSLFTWAWKPVWESVKYYKELFPGVEVWLGGLYASLLPDHAAMSGADRIFKGIFKEAEDLLPDYSLVPEWDGSIVFSSRGCIRSCPFCAVPKLEGALNSVKYSIRKLIYPGHTRVIFWDNNILASPGWRSIFDELEELGLRVDFNQGLDAKLITYDVAERLRRLKLDSGRGIKIRLAYDLLSNRKFVKRAIDRLSAVGMRRREIMVYVLFNYEKDNPEDFFERVRDILSWGAVCYPMRYEPIELPYALQKNSYISPNWDVKRIDMVQRARRVIGYGGAFPPYEGLIKKFEKARCFDEAFSLRPPVKKTIS
ncbi:MAG: hypothetical protein QXP36_02000 [Conexivisphaerales archaeon]